MKKIIFSILVGLCMQSGSMHAMSQSAQVIDKMVQELVDNSQEMKNLIEDELTIHFPGDPYIRANTLYRWFEKFAESVKNNPISVYAKMHFLNQGLKVTDVTLKQYKDAVGFLSQIELPLDASLPKYVSLLLLPCHK